MSTAAASRFALLCSAALRAGTTATCLLTGTGAIAVGRQCTASTPARPPTGHSFYGSFSKTTICMRFSPARRRAPHRRAAARSVVPRPVAGDARDLQAGGRSWWPSPPGCSPRGWFQATCISPHAPAALLLTQVILVSMGAESLEPRACLCSTCCWETPLGGVLEGIVLKFK